MPFDVEPSAVHKANEEIENIVEPFRNLVVKVFVTKFLSLFDCVRTFSERVPTLFSQGTKEELRQSRKSVLGKPSEISNAEFNYAQIQNEDRKLDLLQTYNTKEVSAWDKK